MGKALWFPAAISTWSLTLTIDPFDSLDMFQNGSSSHLGFMLVLWSSWSCLNSRPEAYRSLNVVISGSICLTQTKYHSLDIILKTLDRIQR